MNLPSRAVSQCWKCGNALFKISKEQWSSRKYVSTCTKLFTQPTPISHPHLLQNGEVTPGVTADLYKDRRTKMMEVICKFSNKQTQSSSAHIIVVPSASVVYMSEHIPYSFRQNSDFLYLCGFKEPNSVLILHTLPGKSLPDEYECVLFTPEPTAHTIKWEGPKMDLETVAGFLGIDKAFYINDIEKYLQSFSTSQNRFTVWYDYLSTPFQQINKVMRLFMTEYSGSISVESPRSVLHRLRVIKSDAEVKLMKKTCQIAAESMKEVIKFSCSMVAESHLQAKMDYECRIRGSDRLAFPPVVGGSDRSKTIHYIDNNQIIDDFDMVLMDAGCEFHGYTSDMARTWPVNGKFTAAQRELYEVVLSVQEEIIQLCKTKRSLDYLFKVMCQKLGKGLQELGIISKSASDEELVAAAYELCPHHVSHYLGLDVHDTDLISRNIELQPGMVVTVEPGVYISKTNTQIPDRYRGLCIRIEDDILITHEGFEILTSDCPKKIDEIEELFRKSV